MLKKNRGALIITAWVAAVSAAPLMSQEKGGGDETGPYELVAGWPQNPCGAGYQFGSTSGIFAENPDRVLIFQRGCLPELTDGSWGEPQSLVPSRNASGFDLSREDPARQPRWDHVLYIVNRDGKMIESWEQHNDKFVRPHKERHVWLVDDGAHMVYKFTHDGKKLGTLLYSWGTFGAFPGGFWGVHQFSVDSEGNLYTADVHIGRPQKFRPKPRADPATLVGRPVEAVKTSRR